MYPGTVLTPADLAIFFDSILSPIEAIAVFEGPIKTMPDLSNSSAKSEFSDKKPYPGCTASHPVSLQALIIKSFFK